VDIDEHGFVTIVGRAKRFAKVGGEMVSLGQVEALAATAWPDARHGAVTLPDARKGEQVVLLSTHEQADRDALLKVARAQGVAEIMVPKTVLVVKDLPLLGTGKTDYPAAEALAKELLP
jgi:acyl-[acyl-carrier-protein]-phospholipid O-acyltransferase/long-chain-fatty-acid--[acyl-carrier-protein] ligase